MLVRILLIIIVLMLVHMLASTADAPQGYMKRAAVSMGARPMGIRGQG